MQRRNTIFSIVELLLSFAGAGIAGIVYWAHSHNIDLPCATGNACDLVNASRWSHVHGIPVSLIGFGGYSLMAILSVLKLTGELPLGQKVRSLMLLVSGFGFAYSWYLQYVSHVFIGVICAWCITSAFTMTLLFFVTTADHLGDRPSRTAATAYKV